MENELRAERKTLVKASRLANDEVAIAREMAFRRDRGFGPKVQDAQTKADAAYAACVAFDAAHPEIREAIEQEKRDKANVWN